jgi:hypothetical protein
MWAALLLQIGLGACAAEEKSVTADPDAQVVTTAEAGAEASVDAANVTPDTGPPPLTSKYTRPVLFITEQYQAGLSCDSLCGKQKGRCADASSTSAKPGDPRDCFGQSPYYIPRAWYAAGNNQTSESLECDDKAEAQIKSGLWGTTVYDFLQLDCCCMLRETQWLANDVENPKSCDEVCQARGLECGTHDLCRDVPSLCSKSFPEFPVQSIARYGPDEKGVGKETYPTCGAVPPKLRLQSHKCVCL